VLLNTQNVREAITVGKQCDLALLGIGTTRADFCSLYLGGHISLEELNSLQAAGAIGDVCAHHFTAEGYACNLEFHKRLVGIAYEDLLTIPTRLGVAGHVAKAPAILGALRGGYVNLLVTDSQAAALVLEMAEQHS
jgi:DNA-binding transcriptional regulator LsrR (DeoR family)